MHGLEELIEALAWADKRALERHLIRVIQHVITWTMQQERRSRSWSRAIRPGRNNIHKLQQNLPPSLMDQLIPEQLWDDCLGSAIGEAEGEMDSDLPPPTLTWQENL